MEIIPILLIALICMALLVGFPVAFTLAGTSILFALLGIVFGFFDANLFKTLPMRIFGIMNNQTLLAVPLFVFMGVVLERSGIASKMLRDMAIVFKNTNSGLSISIIITKIFFVYILVMLKYLILDQRAQSQKDHYLMENG